jgi:hypothetical protein
MKNYKNNLKDLSNYHNLEKNEYGKAKKFSLTRIGGQARTIVGKMSVLDTDSKDVIRRFFQNVDAQSVR